MVYQLGENYLRPHKYTYSFRVPLGNLMVNCHLTQGQNHPGGSLGEKYHTKVARFLCHIISFNYLFLCELYYV